MEAFGPNGLGPSRDGLGLEVCLSFSSDNQFIESEILGHKPSKVDKPLRNGFHLNTVAKCLPSSFHAYNLSKRVSHHH